MHCPSCNRERTRIYRVQSDGNPTRRVLTRLCKNPECGTIFTTLENLLSVVQSPANRPYMREITGLLATLPLTDLAAVQKFLASLPSVPARQARQRQTSDLWQSKEGVARLNPFHSPDDSVVKLVRRLRHYALDLLHG